MNLGQLRSFVESLHGWPEEALVNYYIDEDTEFERFEASRVNLESPSFNDNGEFGDE